MMTRWLYEKHMINLPCTDPDIEITRHSQMDLTVVIPVNNHHHHHHHHLTTKSNLIKNTHTHNLYTLNNPKETKTTNCQWWFLSRHSAIKRIK